MITDIYKLKWILSSSGYSIKADDDLGTIVKMYPGSTSPTDEGQFTDWLDYAEKVCTLHNSALKPLEG